MGSDTCLGLGYATLYGASGRQFAWPQAGIEFSSDRVLLQPPFLANTMVASTFRGSVVSSSPAWHEGSGCDGDPQARGYNMTNACQVLDLVVLKPGPGEDPHNGMVIRAVSSYNTSVVAAITLAPQSSLCQDSPEQEGNGAAADAAGEAWSCQTLACGLDPAAANTMAAPAACAPHALPPHAVRWSVAADQANKQARKGKGEGPGSHGGAPAAPSAGRVNGWGGCKNQPRRELTLQLPPLSFTVCTAA